MKPALTTREALGAVAQEITECLQRISSEETDIALGKIEHAPRVFIAAAGRSALGMRGFAMRLMHLGKTVYMVGETGTPAIGAGDLLVIGSGSGRTASLLAMAGKAKELGAGILLFTIDANSPIGALADSFVVIPASSPKAGSSLPINSIQPMGSLFEQCLFLTLDACILRLMDVGNIDNHQMFARHANLE